MMPMSENQEKPFSCCNLPVRDAGVAPKSQGCSAALMAAEDRSNVIWFSGGAATVGTDSPVITLDGEGPSRKVNVRAFGLDRHAVSNDRFGRFVSETGYVTDAERYGWSFVFKDFIAEGTLTSQPIGLPWWHRVEGATWKSPRGPGSNTDGIENHPVVHISWNDAEAFSSWAGGRLPSEVEWEHSAKTGSRDVRFPWGDDEPSDENVYCNIWQGRFPDLNTAADGFMATAPVDAFEPNPAGLFNMCGNTWEWCADRFQVRSLSKAAKERNSTARRNSERLLKGGSYLCHKSYCYRYRIAARMGHSADTSTGHIGFRLAYNPA